MGHQAVARPSLAQCWDASYKVLDTPQRPLSTTATERLVRPGGAPPAVVNCIVAISVTKDNQEDSLCFNQRFLDLGGFRSVKYYTVSDTVASPGYFGLPKDGAASTKIGADGLIERGLRVVTGDVLGYKRVGDAAAPIVYSGKESGIVDTVLRSRNWEGHAIVRFRIRCSRVPQVGDKFASRHGQKGVISVIKAPEDMPRTSSGMIPDILLNAHAIPSRMTIGHLIETLSNKAVCSPQTGEGAYTYVNDATAFEHRHEEMLRALRLTGFHPSGNETFYCGETGRMLEAMLFTGPCGYQCLTHMVEDKAHARATGPVCNLTRQPLQGRANDGGMRLGDMEVAAIEGHGASGFLTERMLTSSDGERVAFCRLCGNMAQRTMGLDPSKLRCSRRDCQSSDFKIRPAPHSNLLLLSTLRSSALHYLERV